MPTKRSMMKKLKILIQVLMRLPLQLRMSSLMERIIWRRKDQKASHWRVEIQEQCGHELDRNEKFEYFDKIRRVCATTKIKVQILIIRSIIDSPW